LLIPSNSLQQLILKLPLHNWHFIILIAPLTVPLAFYHINDLTPIFTRLALSDILALLDYHFALVDIVCSSFDSFEGVMEDVDVAAHDNSYYRRKCYVLWSDWNRWYRYRRTVDRYCERSTEIYDLTNANEDDTYKVDKEGVIEK
jgi:hypothetical protein